LQPINEFARPYQSKNNGIYPVCETGELSSLLGLDPTAAAGWINPIPLHVAGVPELKQAFHDCIDLQDREPSVRRAAG